MKRYLGVVLLLLSVGAGCKRKEAVEITCGGLIDARCSPTMYCELAPGCGGLDREGVCKPRPARCPEERSPVCGCDGKMYESPCYAALQGKSVAHEGECTGADEAQGVTEESGGDEYSDDSVESGDGEGGEESEEAE